MRLAPAPLLVCSDASNSAEAAVSTPIGPHFTGEAHKYALQKGMWNRLLSPGKAYLREHNLLPADQELPAEDDSLEMHPLWHEVVTTQPFSQLGTTKRDGRRRHINVREVRAALSAERDMGLRYPNSFYVHLQDSQVSLACMVKGRSSSPQLNQLLRESIPFHAGFNIHGFYGYCRSKANPADDPTRDAALRPPTRAEPSWLSEAKRGQFSGMDEFLEQQGNSLLHLAGLPPEEELWADVKIDGSTSKSRRSLRGKALGEFKKQEKKETAQHLVTQVVRASPLRRCGHQLKGSRLTLSSTTLHRRTLPSLLQLLAPLQHLEQIQIDMGPNNIQQHTTRRLVMGFRRTLWKDCCDFEKISLYSLRTTPTSEKPLQQDLEF